ncbi:MBL fold metallo-hydrolase [Novosphingobium colocasiae]|uniref:MBL fold metallo-hydrolase n=1 Tax=Novosphingobium colocasiae TaxID=1256513 RepID=UPI0035B06A08
MFRDAADTEPFRRWQVGAIRITRILELPPMAFDPAMFLQADRAEVLQRQDWLVPDYATAEGDIILHFQAFIIEVGGRRIMVDPCIGNHKARSHPALNMLDTAFLDRLASAGFPRESIDHVLCTHLHVDHCGWNTMLVDGQWMPTFPNARYLFAAAELEHVQVDESEPDAQAIYQDSVRPIIEAGLADFIEPGHIVAEGVRLQPTPGHTPGHCSVFIESEGHEAIITGDVIHHPLQAALPDVSSHFCWNEALAIGTRRDILQRAASRGAMVIAAHFAGPTAVRILPEGEAWKVRGA